MCLLHCLLHISTSAWPMCPRRLELAQAGRSHIMPLTMLEAEVASRVQEVDKGLLRLMQVCW